MLIERRSPFSGKVHQMDLPITQEQLERWKNGELVQNVFRHLNADQREFIMTGITPEEWKGYFR
jgi:hypothetical protein